MELWKGLEIYLYYAVTTLPRAIIGHNGVWYDKVQPAETSVITSKAGSRFLAHDQGVLERRPLDIMPTWGLWSGDDVFWLPGPF